MKKTTILFVMFFLLSSLVLAEDLDLKEKIELASKDVSDFLGEIPSEDILVVSGSRISTEDKILFNLIKSNLDIHGMTIITDNKYVNNSKNIVFLGSEKTNSLTKYFSEEGLLKNRDEKDYSPLIIETAEYEGRKALIIYSAKEKNNLENTASKKSPLSRIMDEKYVPAAATFLSILLLYLWHVFSKTLFDFLNEAVSSKLLDKKADKHKIKKNEFLNIHEIIAFVIYVVLFAFSIAYSWSSGLTEFFKLFFLNLVIIGIVSFVREMARLRYCYKHNLRSEFVLWPFGSLITIISTFLGNTFSLASYTLLDETEKNEKKFGKSAFLISLFYFYISNNCISVKYFLSKFGFADDFCICNNDCVY